MTDLSFRYWASPKGHPEYVFVTIPGVRGEMKGLHVRGDRIKWSHDDYPDDVAAGFVATYLSHITTWTDLVAQVGVNPSPPPKASFGGGFGGGDFRGGYPRRGFQSNSRWSPEGDRERNRPYGPEDTHSLKPGNLVDPIPEPTILIVDHREPAHIATALRDVPNLIVQIAQLEVGDYVVPGKLIIERKTSADYHQSIVENAKRMFYQTNSMAETGLKNLIIVEGGVCSRRQMTINAIRGSQTYLALIQQIPMIETIDVRDTVYTIVKSVRHACYGLGYDHGFREALSKKTVQSDPLAAAAHVLEGLPGVSAVLARAMLAHFGTLANAFQATPADLLKIDGIGKVKAAEIYAVMQSGPAGGGKGPPPVIAPLSGPQGNVVPLPTRKRRKN